jgi:hypothetical protein
VDEVIVIRAPPSPVDRALFGGNTGSAPVAL